MLEDIGSDTGYVRVSIDIAYDLGFAEWQNGELVPIKHRDVYPIPDGGVTIAYTGWLLALKAAPRHVRRRLERTKVYR